MRVFRISLVAAMIALCPALLRPDMALSSHKSAGQPFDHTTETVQKAPGWDKAPVVYDKWASKADIAVTLDQHLYAILLPFVQGYAKKKNMDIAIKEGTCGISAGMLAKKSVDMAGFCCPAGKTDRLPGLVFHTVGIAPIAIIVHKDNPVKDITEEQARELFTGEIKNWSEVSGPDIPVTPVARLHCKARPGHWRLILDNENQFSINLNEVGTIPDMVSAVASRKNAVGHLATWNIYKYADQWGVKALKINGISPDDTEALESNQYPFYRSYNITTWSTEGVINRHSPGLVKHLIKSAAKTDKRFSMVPASRLRKTGWKFIGDELVGEPD